MMIWVLFKLLKIEGAPLTRVEGKKNEENAKRDSASSKIQNCVGALSCTMYFLWWQKMDLLTLLIPKTPLNIWWWDWKSFFEKLCISFGKIFGKGASLSFFMSPILVCSFPTAVIIIIFCVSSCSLNGCCLVAMIMNLMIVQRKAQITLAVPHLFLNHPNDWITRAFHIIAPNATQTCTEYRVVRKYQNTISLFK